MRLQQLIWPYGLIALIIIRHNCWTFNSNNKMLIPFSSTNPNREKLIAYTCQIFCDSHLKVVHVYFENDTALSYPGEILKNVNQCGISHVVIRYEILFLIDVLPSDLM